MLYVYVITFTFSVVTQSDDDVQNKNNNSMHGLILSLASTVYINTYLYHKLQTEVRIYF